MKIIFVVIGYILIFTIGFIMGVLYKDEDFPNDSEKDD